MQIELTQAEVNTLINALNELENRQRQAAMILKGIICEEQVSDGIGKVQSLRTKLKLFHLAMDQARTP